MAQRRGAVAERALAGRSRVAASNTRELRARRCRASASASAKCVISVISSTCGSASRRSHAARKRCGREAEPVHAAVHLQEDVLRPVGLVRARASRSAPSQCTVCQRSRREQVSRSRASKQPSSSRIGPRQPSARSRSASARSSSAKPSARCRPAIGALDAVAVGVGLDDRPDPRVGRRRARARARLCASASTWIRAWIGRGMAVDSASARRERRQPCPLRPAPAVRPRKPACYKPPPQGDTCGRRDSGARSARRANEKRLLHHHVGAVLQLAGRQRAVRRGRSNCSRPAGAPSWHMPALTPMFALFYVILAPVRRRLRRRRAEGQGDVHLERDQGRRLPDDAVRRPSAARRTRIVGLGAAAYSPAKYGILTELLPNSQLVKANGWIEGLTIAVDHPRRAARRPAGRPRRLAPPARASTCR